MRRYDSLPQPTPVESVGMDGGSSSRVEVGSKPITGAMGLSAGRNVASNTTEQGADSRLRRESKTCERSRALFVSGRPARVPGRLPRWTSEFDSRWAHDDEQL
jgi:hypothetical protein